MQQKILTVGLGVVAAAAVLGIMCQQRKINRLMATRQGDALTRNEAHRDGAGAARDATSPVAVLPMLPEEPQAVMSGAGETGARGDAPDPFLAEASAPPRPTGVGSNFLGAIAGMMKNPQMKEMMRAQQRVMVGQMYRALSRYVDLTEEQRVALDDLLVERQLALADAGLALLDGADESRARAAEAGTEARETYDHAIRELLGEERHALFKQYELSIPEQTQVAMFKDSMAGARALTDQQEHDLVVAMYEARQTLPTDSLLNQHNQAQDPSQLTEARVAETVRQLEQLQARNAASAAAVLDAEQLAAFKAWQEQMAAMQRAGLEIAVQMFGQGRPPAR